MLLIASLPFVLGALASPAAHAQGTAIWLDSAPDPTLTPQYQATTPERLAPAVAWGSPDERAVAHLAAELEAVLPLRHELDGELQIMRRLGAALAEVEVVRSEDRDLVYRALCLQGYAVRRYFQDQLATDPSAAELRVQVGEQAVVDAWVDAVALDPDRLPTLDELPDEPELLAFQELRASLLLLPPASVVVQDLPAEVQLVVDGRPAPADRMQLTTGSHRLVLVHGETVVQRARVELAPGQSAELAYLAPASDLAGLAGALAEHPSVIGLGDAVVARLATAEAPVELVVSGRKEPLRYLVMGNSAVAVEPDSGRSRSSSGKSRGGNSGVALHAALGGAWVYDGEYLLQNLDDGAPDSTATVNAAAPAGTVGITGLFGPVAVGVGVDGAFPLGEHHSLPVGDSELRVRAFPHLAVGHPLVRVAVGALLPWHLGMGPRLHLPLPDTRSGPLELVAAYTHGIGISMAAADGQGEFTASDARMAWVGLGGRLRLPR